MSDDNTLSAAEGHITEIATKLIESVGGRHHAIKLVATYESENVVDAKVSTKQDSGEESYIMPPAGIGLLVNKLRDSMRAGDKNKWQKLTLTISPTGEIELRFD